MFMSIFDKYLSQVGLSQDMFTQQAHNYTAAMVNAVVQSGESKDPKIMERVAENIATQIVNNSGLLNDAVRVDIRPNPNQGETPLFFERSEPVNGLGGVLLKTRHAMGRLLG
jgi:hypothetical protein